MLMRRRMGQVDGESLSQTGGRALGPLHPYELPTPACMPLTCGLRAQHLPPEAVPRVRVRKRGEASDTKCSARCGSVPVSPCSALVAPSVPGRESSRGPSWVGSSVTRCPAPQMGVLKVFVGSPAWAQPPQRPVARLRGPSRRFRPSRCSGRRARAFFIRREVCFILSFPSRKMYFETNKRVWVQDIEDKTGRQ